MDKDLVTSIAKALAHSKEGWGSPDFIDAGASGGVFSLRHPEHGLVALKIYDPKFFEGENALIEEHRVQLQTQLVGAEHPNLIRTIDASPIPEYGTWYLLMEYCPWPSLEKVIKEVPDAAVPSLVMQLVQAVLFLQELGLIHRDIKPANMAVAPDFSSLKLLDLGVLRQISPQEGNGTDDDEKRRFIATAQYSPPEYISREEVRGAAGFAALNIYQVGAVLHDLIMKRPIFEDEASTNNRYVLFKAVLQKIPTVFNPNLPARLLSICRASLQKNASKRAKAVELSDFLSCGENVSEVRRRLGAQRGRGTASRGPSALVWERRVAGWLRTAARAESDVLGGCRLAKASAVEGQAWDLAFREQRRVIRIELKPDGERPCLLLNFVVESGAETVVPALEIFQDGPNIPEDQVVPQLSEQLLFALDAADAGAA